MIRPLQEEVRSHLRSGVAITNLTQCVEELVLNGLDAGASCITIRIDIPNFKIQVSDNGNGIALADLKSVGERYSSSKCHVLEDLQQLSFYGFRGEALASIREICDVLEIVTRHRSSYQTYCKLFRNSQVLELTESRFPRTSAGTSVTIHSIFANLPVRRKAITETLDFERVRHRIASIALIHPKTAFLLINDSTGSKCLQTHVCKSVVSTFSQLFGNQRSKNLQPVKFEYKDFKVSGFISTDTHHSKSLQFLFVNGRLLLKTKIHKLVNNILGKSELLRKLPVVEVKDNTKSESFQSKTTSPQHAKSFDKHGIFVLNIDCLVTEYDICLEPAKTLVEFQDWDKVLYCFERCIEEFLIKHNLISNSEDSETSSESGANDGDCHMAVLCRTNLAAFEYKREIETSNVKKSLHSSTVFRPKKAERVESGNQSETSSCLIKGHSDLCFSDGELKHISCDSDTAGNDVEISEDLTASDSKSISKAVVTANTDKCLSSGFTKHFNGDAKQVAFNDKASCHVTHTHSSTQCTTDTTSNPVKVAQNKVDDTLSAQSHYVLGDLQKSSTSHSVVSGIRHSTAPITVLNELSNKNSGDRMCASNAFSRATCSRVSTSPVSFNMFEDMQLKHLGSDTICSSVCDKFIPSTSRHTHQESSFVLPSKNTHQKSSVALPKRSEKRSEAMSAFTSPCPITLKRLCTRKRPQSNKETSATELTLASKNKRLITLQPGSCKRRVRYDRNNEGEYSDCVTYSGQVLQEPADNDCTCNTTSSATADNNVIAQTSTNNGLDTASCNSEVNCDSSVGMTVSSEETCDSCHSFDPIQPVLSDSVDQMCLSRSGIENPQSEEHNHLKSAVASNFNVTEKERIMHNSTEYLDCAQSESAEEKGMFLERDKFSQCSMMAESNSEPKLISVDKTDIQGRPLSSNKDWHCTFDASLGRKLFINTRTGHTSFEAPCEFNVEDDDCSEASVTEANKANDCSQHLPHPFASHLSFSCTPWLPREDRRHRLAACHEGNDVLCSEGMSQLTILYKEHLERQETEEKLCKWTDADTLQAYEQDLLNSGDKTVAELLDSWQNPVFTAPEKDILMVNKPAGDKKQISVHNVVHPYCFTREMLAGMRVLRQLDDKFIVGIVSQEGEDDGLLVLVDQHAAHERVRLEHLQSELFDDGDVRQTKGKPCFKSSPVSPPLEFPLFPEEVRLLKTFQTEIERIGIRFVIRESSLVSQETMILVHGVPSAFVEREVSEVKRGRPSVAASNVKALIREHLDHVSTTCGVSAVIPKVIFQVISSLACHGAVKFGEPLGINECQELIKCLSKCQLPFQCAHGRPSVIPLVDLRFLGKKMNSEEIVRRPRIAKLQPALVNQSL